MVLIASLAVLGLKEQAQVLSGSVKKGVGGKKARIKRHK